MVEVYEQISRLQTAVNRLGRAYDDLHSILQTKVIADYEQKLVSLQKATGKSIDETKKLSDAFVELAKEGKYSRGELADMATEITSTASTYNMSNEELKKTLDLWQNRFPIGADKAIKAVKSLTQEFKGMSAALKDGPLKLGDSMSKIMIGKWASTGQYEKIAEFMRETAPARSELAPNLTAYRKGKVGMEESRANFAGYAGVFGQQVSGAMGDIMGSPLGTAIQFGMGGLGALAVGGSLVGSVGKFFGGKGGGSSGGNLGGGGLFGGLFGGGGSAPGGTGTRVFVTNWPGSLGGVGGGVGGGGGGGVAGSAGTTLLSRIGPMLGLLAGGAAITGGVIALTSQLDDLNKWMGVGVHAKGFGPTIQSTMGKGGGKSEADIADDEGKAWAEAQILLGRRLELSQGELDTRRSITETIKTEIDMSNMLGQRFESRVGSYNKIIESARQEVEASEKVLEIVRKEAIDKRKIFEEEKRNGGPERAHAAKMALLDVEKRAQEAEKQWLSQKMSLQEKILSKIQDEYQSKLDFLEFDKQRNEIAKEMFKLTYAPPAAQAQAAGQQIKLLEKQSDMQAKLTSDLETARDQKIQELTSAGKLKEADQARADFAKQIEESKVKQLGIERDILKEADYVRRTWMEQFTETMLGAESGTYLMPGSGALSGLQEKGAAFMPFADANRGGGFGTYQSFYSPFDQTLQMGRTAAEQQLGDKLADGVSRVVEHTLEALNKRMTNAIVG